jgi:membrane protease YdiL (CAAX protease family)
MPVPSTNPIEQSSSKSTPWLELAIVIVLYIGIHLLIPNLSQILVIALVVYMIVESKLRHRTRADFGINYRGIPSGVRNNLGWILLVTFGTQMLFIFGEKFFLPEAFVHLIARVPLDISKLSMGLIVSIALATFLEEVLFRAFFQTRIRGFVKPAVAIGLTSLIFALAHFSPGPALIVFVDLLSVFVDSVIFGIVFERSKNVFVSWIPHFLADIFAILLLILIK